MTTSIAPPEFVVAFGNKHSYEPLLFKQRFKGGIEERSHGMSIHPVLDTWALQLEIHGLDRYQAVENYITAQDGEPFRFDWNGSEILDASLYRIESYQWHWNGWYHWQLSVELKRVFRP